MAREAKGRIVKVGPARTRYITIPATIAADSQFPFTDNEEVRIEILSENGSVTVSKLKK